MARRFTTTRALLLAWLLLTGCHPTQPFYLRESGDMSKLLDVATKVEFPDVDSPHNFADQELVDPITITNFENRPFWDVTLEEIVAISLNNSKVIRTIGQIRQGGVASGQTIAGIPDSLTSNGDFSTSIYDPSIQESGTQGVQQALAAFDAQFKTSAFWENTDRPQNFTNTGNQFFVRRLQRDQWNFQAEISKRAADGTQFFVRNVNTYDSNNQTLRAQTSEWFAATELEARHPFGKNGGTQVNRIPVMLARIREDISLADFEAQVIIHVSQVERTYWDLYLFYRTLKANVSARDSAYRTWQKIAALSTQGIMGAEADRIAQAKQQYHQFDARLKDTLRNLLLAERQLRYLIGIEDSDGRMLRPADRPTEAHVAFEWREVLTESMMRRIELRKAKWRIKEAEMQLSAAKNQLLPRLDAVALYRFLGLGDEYWSADRRGLNFPQNGSTAWDELTEGKYQEYRTGFELEMPIGFRQELAQVRSSQLTVRRAKERLFEAENEVRSQLGTALVNLDAEYEIAQNNLASYAAAAEVVSSTESEYNFGRVPLDLLLEAQQKQADAEIAFHDSLVKYNLAILETHRLKGSLLEYNSIMLAEGPWPKKAYYDALDRARQRDASINLHYGFTRPRVVSRGEYEQITPQDDPVSAGMPFDGTLLEGEMVPPGDGQPILEGLNSVSPNVEEESGPWGDLGLADPQPTSSAVNPSTVTPAKAEQNSASVKKASASDAWGDLGL